MAAATMVATSAARQGERVLGTLLVAGASPRGEMLAALCHLRSAYGQGVAKCSEICCDARIDRQRPLALAENAVQQ